MQSPVGKTFMHFRAMEPYAVALLFLALMVVISHFGGIDVAAITENYFSIHTVFELIGVLVSLVVFTVGWATYENAQDADILVLSVASFAVGALDFGHMLSFAGMPDFFGANGLDKAINFWFASRITGAFAFLYVAISPPRLTRLPFAQWLLLGIAVAWVAIAYWVILFHPEFLPEFYSPTKGLMPIKVTMEWILIGISVAAGIILFVGAEKRENMNVRWMACASLLYGMAGYFFAHYTDVGDMYSFTGHCYKAISFLLLYRAVFLECVARPYERMQMFASQAEASNLSKSRFLANVSHEFRTPLGVIGGFGDLLLTSGQLEPRAHGWAQTIVRNAKQLSLLIDDLLDLAKAETEKIEVRLTPVEIGPLLEQVKQALGLPGKESLQIRINDQMMANGVVVTDELRLRQILMNIVGNAVKFTLKGYVQISARRKSKAEVEILIEDSGIGIDPQDVDRLFQPFSQVTNPNRRHFGGTGLGLSLSRKLTQLLGGDLKLQWSQPGRGSCFAITFTDYAHSEAVKANLSPAPIIEMSPPVLAGRKILIAEDSEDNQMLLESYLRPTGIEITFAENGKLAVDQAMQNRFDLILMDIQMPVMDGFEATAELRRQGWGGKIVALTAHALQPERERAMKNGFDDYLVKPIKREQLWSSIAGSLGV